MIDFHNFCEVKDLALESLLVVVSIVPPEFKVACIFAATSSLAVINATTYRDHSRQYLAVEKTFKKYIMQPLTQEKALNLASQVHSDEELKQFVLKNTCGIPGLITLKAGDEKEYLSLQFRVMTREWTLLASNIHSSLYSLKESLLLLSSFKNELPYTIYGFTDDDIENHILVRSHVLHVNTEKKLIKSYFNDLSQLKKF